MYNSTCVDTCQPLIDRSGSGRVQPWAQHRTDAEILAAAYADLDEAKLDRLLACAPRLTYTVDPQQAKSMRLASAWFCRVRLCPICQWRRSLKIYGQMADIVKAANAQAPGGNGYGWILLTLTVRNVPGINLSQTITDMSRAWQRMTQTTIWRKIVLGTMRSLEVTHNTDADSPSYDTYHPHIHALLCVRRSYYHSADYLTRAQWQDMWRAAARLSYAPQVDVRRVGNRDMSQDEIVHQVAETCKYAVKPGDYIIPTDYDMMERTVAVLDRALHKRRLVAWTGSLKEIHAKLQLDDIDTGDMIHTTSDAEPETNNHMMITYQWLSSHRNYYREVEVETDAETASE